MNGVLNNLSIVNPLPLPDIMEMTLFDSIVNPLPLPDIMEVTLFEEKRSSKTTNHDSHCHGYAPFPSST